MNNNTLSFNVISESISQFKTPSIIQDIEVKDDKVIFDLGYTKFETSSKILEGIDASTLIGKELKIDL